MSTVPVTEAFSAFGAIYSLAFDVPAEQVKPDMFAERAEAPPVL